MSDCQDCNRTAWYISKDEKLCFQCKVNKEMRDQQHQIETLQKAVIELVEMGEFYRVHQPRQFPEGYYEICLEEGHGGHDRFGTKARTTLQSPIVKEAVKLARGGMMMSKKIPLTATEIDGEYWLKMKDTCTVFELL
jgi:hypothetical protein